jgi:Helix-turn-helix domain
MNPDITRDQPNEVARTTRITPRKRRPLPPQDTRDWMTPGETALALGCSVATVHRLRRGIIPGVEPLPCSQYGRKFVFRKASITPWQENNEKRGLR